MMVFHFTFSGLNRIAIRRRERRRRKRRRTGRHWQRSSLRIASTWKICPKVGGASWRRNTLFHQLTGYTCKAIIKILLFSTVAM